MTDFVTPEWWDVDPVTGNRSTPPSTRSDESENASGDCEHAKASRVAPLYVDGRPLYKCDDCDARFVYEDDEPSFKALAPIKNPGTS